jgi:hypothetical protein
MADRQLLLPQLPRPTRPLGRNINHDPQSLRFLVAPKTATVTPRTVFWPRRTPLLNQGLPEPGVGSCTLSSSLGVLGSDPFWNTLPDEIRQRLSDGRDAQRLAVELYGRTTENDPFPGTYPPEDTGSDGNSAAKTLRDTGLISGWEHITSLAAAEVAIQRGPFITGTVWLSGMDSPTAPASSPPPAPPRAATSTTASAGRSSTTSGGSGRPGARTSASNRRCPRSPPPSPASARSP